MLKIGLIGLGDWGKKVLPHLIDNSNVVLCSNRSDSDSKKWLVQQFPDIEHTFDYKTILSNNHIDSVVITTPIKNHYNIALEALNSNKHVFVEKPLSTNSKEVRHLFTVARNKNLNLFVGYIFTTSKILSHLKSVSTKDPITRISMNWSKYGSFKEELFANLLSHELSIIYNLLGSDLKTIKIVEAIGVKSEIDIVNLEIEFMNSQKIIIKINRASETQRKESFFKTLAGIQYKWFGDELHFEENGQVKIVKDYKNKLAVEMNTFLEQTESGVYSYNEGLNLFISETITRISKT